MLSTLHEIKFLDNSLYSYCLFGGIILIGLLFQKLISKLLALFVFKFLQKYSTGVSFEKLLALLKKPLGMFILSVALYSAFSQLQFPESWECAPVEKFGLRMFSFRLFQIAIVVSITWILLRLVDFFGLVFMYKASLTETKTDDQLVPFLRESVKVVISILSIFFILGAIFQLNVASLIAGLGIGGLAIALAAKESLENLLGSFTIFFDKPFVIGDLVKVGNIEGHVENIGFRSTRIRTAEKSYVTVPNKKLTDNELDNFSHRSQRRVSFNVGLSYDTKVSQIKNIVLDIKKYIDQHPKTAKEEVHVKMFSFDINSINIMVLYFVDSIDYTTYVEVREDVNLKIMEIVEMHKSSLAHLTMPTVKEGK